MQEGIRTVPSRYSVDDSVARITELLTQRGIKLFCVVDHSGEAIAAGLTMPATRLLLFGNARAGTPVMLAAPSTALDLPLRILIAEGPDGQATLSWNDPAWLQQRHGFAIELAANLGAAEKLAQSLA